MRLAISQCQASVPVRAAVRDTATLAGGLNMNTHCEDASFKRAVCKASPPCDRLPFHAKPSAPSDAPSPFGPTAGHCLRAPNGSLRSRNRRHRKACCRNVSKWSGPYTGLATIVAEELDADWSRDPCDLPQKVYNKADGRHPHGRAAIADSYDGAQGRRHRARDAGSAASQYWKVRSRSRRARGLRHAASKREGRFGTTEAAAKLPVPDNRWTLPRSD